MRIVFFLSVLFIGSYCFACSCLFPFEDLERSDAEATYVFIGAVDSKSGFFGLSNTGYTFRDIEMLKGEIPEKTTVWSSGKFSACGMRFEKKKRYVVYAYLDKNKLNTNRCSSWEEFRFGTATDEVRKFYADKEQL